MFWPVPSLRAGEPGIATAQPGAQGLSLASCALACRLRGMADRHPSYLTLYTIYERPSDYPRHYVMRRSWVASGALQHEPRALLCKTADDARQAIRQLNPGAVCIQRQGDDPDPVIFEVYV